ncbi:MAG: hypothetical protein K0Q50_2068 [Vampirovibrio sp.]|jgi:hypothetical protein|nr:hypothetical protein [Vampirovibrio sp.]
MPENPSGKMVDFSENACSGLLPLVLCSADAMEMPFDDIME